MRFYELIKPLHAFRARRAIADFHVRGVCCDSRKAKPGSVFVAVRGASVDGMKFVSDAAARGARAVIAEPGSGYHGRGVELVEVPDCRRALSAIASEFYGRPSSRLEVAGVTGTNGKTTVTYLIEKILEESGARPAVIGTVNHRFRGRVFPSGNTTPGPLELNILLKKMLRERVTHLAMEVSSHALEQERVRDIFFSSAVFTNLTQDHLDYHGDMRRYFQAKSRLFRRLPESARAIINSDDPSGRKLGRLTRARVITYGIGENSDIRAGRISMNAQGSSFTLSFPGGSFRAVTGLIGRHNIHNILAASGWALSAGIPADTVRRAIAAFEPPPGRLEKVRGGKGFSVFVDYAHTEDALKNVICSLRQVCRGRIIVVFGCGGDRDRTKRPKMGRAASRWADYSFLTSDNPRSEDPLEIISQIEKGMKKGSYRVVVDRRQAISAAVSRAKRGDVVLIAGKGHEDYQVFVDGRVPFDDRKVAGECLR